MQLYDCHSVSVVTLKIMGDIDWYFIRVSVGVEVLGDRQEAV